MGRQALFSIWLKSLIKWRDYRLAHASPGSQALSPNPREAQKHAGATLRDIIYLFDLFKIHEAKKW